MLRIGPSFAHDPIISWRARQPLYKLGQMRQYVCHGYCSVLLGEDYLAVEHWGAPLDHVPIVRQIRKEANKGLPDCAISGDPLSFSIPQVLAMQRTTRYRTGAERGEGRVRAGRDPH